MWGVHCWGSDLRAVIIGPHDLIDIPGLGQFEVVGYAEDSAHGPWGFPFDFPTPHSVGVHKYSSVSTDGYGREVATYTPAKDSVGAALAVHGWSNPMNTEPKLAGHDRVVIDLELYVPTGLVVNLRKVEG